MNLKNNEVVTAHRSCPRGLDICHHVAASLYFAHYNITPTDTERTWNVTQGSEPTEKIQTVEELFGNNETYEAIVDTNKLKINEFKEHLGESDVGFSWLVTPEANPAMVVLVPNIENKCLYNVYSFTIER